jgi:hypothetical protein
VNISTSDLRARGFTVEGGRAVRSDEPAKAQRAKRQPRPHPALVNGWIWLQQHKNPGVFLPLLRRVNESNSRDHWRVKAKRAKEQRNTANLALRQTTQPGYLMRKLGLPATVTLTRYGPKLMDDDGNQRALKAIRDGVADDGGLAFRYAQEKAPAYGVRIEVQPAAPSVAGGTP